MPPRNRASRQEEAAREHEHPERTEQQKDDTDLTLDEWKNLPREILTLKCNQHRLVASGSKSALANRLFDYFASGRTSTARARPAPDDRRKESSTVAEPATPDVSKNIFKEIAPEIERLIS